MWGTLEGFVRLGTRHCYVGVRTPSSACRRLCTEREMAPAGTVGPPYTRGMKLAELIEAARELAPADRVRLADEVMASVEVDANVDPQVEAAWKTELHRRVSDIEAGRVELVDGRETMRIARQRIAERRVKSGA